MRLISNNIKTLQERLTGTWKGSGKGSFPTLESFDYEELLVFKCLKEEPYLEVSQKAWTLNGEERQLVHWETGIITMLSDRQLKWYCSHMNGRMEVYGGNILCKEDTIEIHLKSEFVKNEIGLKTALHSERIIHLSDKELSYTMKMSTTEVSKLTQHLKASLKKQETNNP